MRNNADVTGGKPIAVRSQVSIPHSQVILVKRGRLGGISEMPLLSLRG
jgi:hypothetical protein